MLIVNQNVYSDFILIRHGETNWNKDKKMMGHADIPLNDEGKEQALKIKGALNDFTFDAAYSSDLSRAFETACIVLDSRNLEIKKTEKLRAKAFGSWTGSTIADFSTWFNENHKTKHLQRKDYLDYKYSSEIENISEIYARVEKFIQGIYSSHENSTVLLAAHGCVLRAILYSLDEFEPGLNWDISNCGYIHLRVETGNIKIMEKVGCNQKYYNE